MPNANASGDWTAPSGARDHFGLAIDPDKLFCWPPPYEIGVVLFADTNARRRARPSPAGSLATSLGLGVAVYIAVLTLMTSLLGKPTAGYLPMDQFLGVGLGFAACIIALLITWPRLAVCSYVAGRGAAILKGRRGALKPRDRKVLIFAETDVLFASITNLHTNNTYTKTVFDFQWRRGDETSAVMRISGEHGCKDAIPPTGDFSFAVRAQERWLGELIGRHGSSVPGDAAIVFPCRDSRIKEIRLHRDRVEFVYGQHVDSESMSDIGNLATQHGGRRFDRNDPTWFGGKGMFRVEYSNLGNAMLFLYYMSQLL